MNSIVNNVLTELQKNFRATYGNRLVKLILFGSQAREEALGDSDIDILVVLKGTVNLAQEISRTSQIKGDLSLKYNTVISCIYISEERYIKERSPLLLNVQRDGVPV